MVDLSVRIGTVTLSNPVMPASGTFADTLADVIDFNRLGALVTKTITPDIRHGNPQPRVTEMPSAMLCSIGIPSKGPRYYVEHTVPFYAKYRPPDAVNPTNPHLHNVPVNIAAERGLPALALWLWFIATAARDLLKQVRNGPATAIAAAGLAAIVAMLAAGLFEYNFGDSEFLMLFLGLITLPFAARGVAPPRAVGRAS